MLRLILGCAVTLSFTLNLPAQSFATAPCQGGEGKTTTSTSWLSGNLEQVCEVRRITLPVLDGQVRVEAKNGGIEVLGEDRQDIVLEARVTALASSPTEATSIEHEVKIITTGTIHADGPSAFGWSRSRWTVNYRLQVPRHLAAQLHTENGGIKITNVAGVIDAGTTNGGLTLDDLAGEVHASTVNGGMDIKLAGSQWSGAGLFAKSTNGGIRVKAPSNYSAHLIAETTNGGVSVGFPVRVQGRFGNHIESDLGQGGPTISFHTVNGGVGIHQN